jgi:hypothetical protein
MSFAELIWRNPPNDRPNQRISPGSPVTTILAGLEADSHHPETQKVIGAAIRHGKIRVMPIPGCASRVKIVRVGPAAPEGPVTASEAAT